VVALPRGTVHYALASTDNFVYTRSSNAKVNPFVSAIDFVVASITDADNISAISTANASPAGIDIRFGRLRLENSFGPETLALVQHLKLEHYVGGDFVTTQDNSCVNYDASKISLNNMGLDPSLSGVNTATGTFINGQTQAIELASPGRGNQGVIGVSYEAYEWLKYDWASSGTLTQDPSSTATFGIYRGDDRLFHSREVFN
jgi:MSHA biogenesis protein MshQ